jgi:hypothetical protein
MKNTIKFFLLTLLIATTVNGCGVWDSITGDDDYVKLKGEAGASCSLDSECRSNSCIYPGICQ